MFASTMSFLEESLNFALSTFISFVNGSFFGLFISFFIILLVTRLILVPLLGRSLSSDSVKPDRVDRKTHRERYGSSERRW